MNFCTKKIKSESLNPDYRMFGAPNIQPFQNVLFPVDSKAEFSLRLFSRNFA